MKPTIESIESMGDRLARWISSRAGDPKLGIEVCRYVESIKWKLRFLDHHSALLSSAQWDSIGRLGTMACKPEEMINLKVNDGLLLRLGTSENATMIMLA